MRSKESWTEGDFLQLISNGVQESTELDYKACEALQKTDKKKAEISKDVSALANSAGGVLIYGIVESGHVPTSIDRGFDPSDISKEWLEQVINSRIQRKIDGVRIHSVDLAKSQPGKVAYVVDVPQSSRAPHQASDKRFYKRYNFESVPMEEYEVRDVSRRSDGPDLSVSFRIDGISESKPPAGSDADPTYSVKVVPTIQNSSPVPAEYIGIRIFLDKNFERVSAPGELKKTDENSGLNVNGTWRTCSRYQMNHGGPNKMPIFSGTVFNLLNGPITVSISADGEYLLGYSLISPHMNEALGASLLVFKNGRGHIIEIRT